MPRAHSETSSSFVGRSFASKRGKIIELNDQFRTTFKGGRVQMTRAVYQLHPQLCGRALCVMSRYNKFADDSEHDCGVFIFAGYAFEWCIEYRSKDGSGVSPDPADPDKTLHVLTLYAADDLLRSPFRIRATRTHVASAT
jgi:hypothetical protein